MMLFKIFLYLTTSGILILSDTDDVAGALLRFRLAISFSIAGTPADKPVAASEPIAPKTGLQ